MARTSYLDLIKEAAMKSMSSLTPNFMSSMSLSVRAGSLISTPGTLTPLWEEITPEFSTSVIIFSPLISFTRSSTRPSSIKILSPAFTSL